MFIISRPISECSLNGTENLLNSDGMVLCFESYQEAENIILNRTDYSKKDIEEGFILIEEIGE
jgi:hypothetical protein